MFTLCVCTPLRAAQIVPTPFVAAGVAVLGAAAGVMVTASHNPKEYNGYKVYWGNGCQVCNVSNVQHISRHSARSWACSSALDI